MFTSVMNTLREYVTEKRLESNFGKKNADDVDIWVVEDKDENEQEQQQDHQHAEEAYQGYWGG